MKAILALLIAVLLGFNIYQMIDRRDLKVALSNNEASLHARAEAAARPERERVKHLDDQNSDLAKKVADLEKKLDGLEKNADSEVAANAPKENPMKAMAQMLENPAMKDMMVAQQKAQMDLFFKGLYEKLNLSPEELEHFKGILTDMQMINVESGMKLMGENLTGPEREALLKKIKEDQDAAKARIKEFLNDESDYAYYEFYSTTLNERMTANGLNKSLAEKGIPLAPEQEEALVQLMYDERQKIAYEFDYNDQNKFDPTSLTEASVARFLEQQAQLQHNVASSAGTLLTPEQQEIFTQSQEQMRAMQEMGLKMAQQMFKPGE